MTRLELVTPSLPRKYSTSELHRLKSGRRDSNPRPTAWKAVALPTELLPHYILLLFNSGESRIRTYVAEAADLQSAPFDRSGISP